MKVHTDDLNASEYVFYLPEERLLAVVSIVLNNNGVMFCSNLSYKSIGVAMQLWGTKARARLDFQLFKFSGHF